jgi:hypothetical protein
MTATQRCRKIKGVWVKGGGSREEGQGFTVKRGGSRSEDQEGRVKE